MRRGHGHYFNPAIATKLGLGYFVNVLAPGWTDGGVAGAAGAASGFIFQDDSRDKEAGADGAAAAIVTTVRWFSCWW